MNFNPRQKSWRCHTECPICGLKHLDGRRSVNCLKGKLKKAAKAAGGKT